ncbi:hypothetical protein GLOIN_2v1790753 [Rhizophagus irregularis DAOM 181602=DAOM 197198]|uniref:BED-type domain-containing protein n=2 Tax=Rhizophagus irregularis TaxID=588596 RepID=A0A015JYL7_RHIIW|nr:hypothetical protein GLOIN_2v1790753 [Rhizophagus irregularis DAOM 181602=DAOM 197198]EXX60144.1 hypothetical protein RirG_182580 [Rhizophagus irregularis DAOM 197198w]POG58177.1 hypothetical protein GLOIN_2v1790753 [Rhizophagus irregularis DAOM 181602=DAOM 197198]GBC54542.1 hypothetical protein GLOIN_2v1790753 [Rhizophagus irregularis DAOM 181602=DAOM 197198]|eukprot:XP_025165043.1 hypothetical protein GLOIN_2v1790753 [Rhizophagus irregularis DAOM 181602=DAOM 197198]
MANISSSSFSSFEDSEYDESFLYDNFVEREDFSISFDSIENISKTEEIADNEEVQTRLISDVWKYFTRKEQVKVNQNGGEEIEKFILCNVGQCYLSGKNSTSTLERHLKARHHDAYIELHE